MWLLLFHREFFAAFLAVVLGCSGGVTTCIGFATSSAAAIPPGSSVPLVASTIPLWSVASSQAGVNLAVELSQFLTSQQALVEQVVIGPGLPPILYE